MKFEIICDSSADLPDRIVRACGIHVVPYYVSLDGESYLKEGQEMPVIKFYDEMVSHPDCFPKTSMPTAPDYMDAFRPFAEKNMPVLCICLTEQFSGSVQSARNAASALKEEYPDAEIEVIDSRLVTALEGLFVTEAVRLRDHGLTLQDAVPRLLEIRCTGQIFFTTKDLKYLQHGGRLGKVACIAGSMLNLKPVLHFSDGKLDSPEICRGRRRSLQKIIENFFRYMKAEQIDLSEYRFATGIGHKNPEYEAFRQDLQLSFEKTGIHPVKWEEYQIGATIGVHTGPYPMGLGILKKCRLD